MLMGPPSSGPSLCLAAPSSRCAGGTDRAPSASDRRALPFSALLRRAAATMAEALQVVEIHPDFKPLSRPDFSQSRSATCKPAPSGDATGNPDVPAGLPAASAAAEEQPRSAWGKLYPADRVAKTIDVESSAEERLTLPQICGGWSRAGPA